MTIEEARETLRIDGDSLDIIIRPLLEAIPPYLEITTGKDWNVNPVHPLAKTTAGFILELWFDGETKELKKTIDNLLAALTVIGRK